MTEGARTRGSGRVYQRGAVWWIQYSLMGSRFRESAHSPDRREAERLLRRRLGEAAVGRHAPQTERVTLGDLVALVVGDYKANGRRSLNRVRIALDRVEAHFGPTRAVAITGDRITGYLNARLESGAARATVAYELAALRRGFNLAIRAGRLIHRPHFPTLNLDNARQGFVGEADFERLLACLPPEVRPPIAFAFHSGWRLQSEVLRLTWDRVDFEAGEVRLHTSKNGQPRVFPFGALPALRRILDEQALLTRQTEHRKGAIIPFVFHRSGRPIRDVRGAWAAACQAAGIVGLIPHDLRRTAVRRLERAGVPRAVAMQLTGHKTENVYRRYAIVAKNDLAEGVAKLAQLEPDRAGSATLLRLRTGTGGAQ